MLLTLDVGNTNVTVGVFDGARTVATWRFATDHERLADEYAVMLLGLLGTEQIERTDVTGAVMACVVPELLPVFERLCNRYFKTEPLIIGTGTRTGVRILYDNPREVGADRIVDVVAGVHEYGPPPLIIVDVGTATVFDAVSAEGDYLGGAIAPGMGLAYEALIGRAAKLYRVELEAPKTVIGKNTAGAIQSGTVLGYVGLVESMVARFKKELGGSARVIGTGGWSQLIAGETDVFDVVDIDLTLKGLRLLYDMNARRD
jgi:type III pantothenate kinase